MENKNETPKYTTIIHKTRIELDLTCNEYCVADIIYHLSSNPKNEMGGWCWASKKTISDFMGLHENTIFEIIEKLIKKELIERHEKTKYLKTTQKWYELVIIERIKNTTKNVVIPQKGYTKTTKSVVETPQKGDTININNNNNYNSIISTHSVEENKTISSLIDKFKSVNPSYTRLFMRKSEREATSRLLGNMGQEKLEKAIELLPNTNKEKYAPTITTPSQLEEKLASLISFLQKHKSESKVIKL